MKTAQERFEAKFTKGDGCWNWTASKYHDGYGRVWLTGRYQRAHRAAYQLYVGVISDDLCVLHRCDNRQCVRPDHLFLGTRADNARDCKNKGRWTFGEKHGMAKLTAAQVIEIRAKHSNDARTVDLAKEFGVSHQAISKIVHYREWRQAQ